MISELFKEEGVSIYSFKQGGIIIRIKPSFIRNTKTNENLGTEVQTIDSIDQSFRTEPVEFVAVKNNVIYLKSLGKFWSSLNGGKPHVYKVLLEQYEEDWKLFEIPDGLTIEDCID